MMHRSPSDPAHTRLNRVLSQLQGSHTHAVGGDIDSARAHSRQFANYSLIQPNVASLKGKTAFISGASRGIGLSIAQALAKAGCNVVLAAKTVEPHPQLPGTIFTAAQSIVDAGGNALPIQCDIRDEKSVSSAVAATVAKFGGIDIVVNNASAISLTNTLDTTMKKYDLMQGINTRGTYLVTKLCLPYLLKSKHAHVLNISPPLDMKEKWFAPHTAYTIAKFGMSLCALGMSGELREQNVAVNTLWPLTTIATAAVQNLLGGDSLIAQSRTPDIMSDAALNILASPTNVTGQFFIDEHVMRATGMKDFAKYAVTKGTKDEDLALDFFV